MSGQGQLRNILPYIVLNQVFESPVLVQHSHRYISDPNLLSIAKVLYFQRCSNPAQLEIISWYKSQQKVFGYKMILDHDDLIWGKNELYEGGNKLTGVPSYNPAHDRFDYTAQNCAIEIMKMMDKITVSTEFLKDFIHNVLKIDVPVEVVPNTVSIGYWGNKLKLRNEDIKKPKIIYTGASGHYDNKNKLMGDWSDEWKWWVIREVNMGKIDFVCMGGPPFFLEPIKNKIKVYDWMPLFKFPLVIRDENPHYCINPLAENMFNAAKSDLKLVESAAASMIGVGTVFDNLVSPYDNAIIKIPVDAKQDDISKAIYCYNDKDKHNEALMAQYKWFNDEGRFTESATNLNRLLGALLD